MTHNPARYAERLKVNPNGFHTWADARIAMPVAPFAGRTLRLFAEIVQPAASVSLPGASEAAQLLVNAAAPTGYVPDILILMGERDGVVPACHGQAIADLIDGAVLEVVPGSHLFPFTHAAAISARISAFLDEPERAQAAA